MKVLITYTVIGKDHDGYCSDQDGDDYEITSEKLYEIREINEISGLKMETKTHSCTAVENGGSGYTIL